MFIEEAREMDVAGKIRRPNEWVRPDPGAPPHHAAAAPTSTTRRSSRSACSTRSTRSSRATPAYVTAIGLYQIASAQFQKVYEPRKYLICGQAGPLGWEVPAAIGAKTAEPDVETVAVVGDYSFQFLIEELAVAAQFKVPLVIILFNNAYLGLIRMASKAYDEMDFQIQLSFDNINSPDNEGYGVDFVKVAEGFGCRARRVKEPGKIREAIEWARAESKTMSVPCIIECITERKTDIAMGPALDQIKEFEEVIDLPTEMDLSLPGVED